MTSLRDDDREYSVPDPRDVWVNGFLHGAWVGVLASCLVCVLVIMFGRL